MASQRHKMIVQNYGATCYAIDEKQPAAGYMRQIPGPYVQPVGPAGGPLKGSSLAGPPPAAIPAPQLDHPLLAMGLILAGSQTPPEPPASQSSEQERSFPIGPITIDLIDDHPDGISAALTDASEVRIGDTVTIEATGNTSVNGDYTVLMVDGNVVVIDNEIVLSAPIEAKGRLTVTNGEA